MFEMGNGRSSFIHSRHPESCCEETNSVSNHNEWMMARLSALSLALQVAVGTIQSYTGVTDQTTVRNHRLFTLFRFNIILCP
jgi:hypothetical protein